MIRRSIFVGEEIWSRLKNLSVRDGLGVSELIRRAIIEFLKREE